MREQQNEEITVTLTLDNDEVLECAVLTIYEAGGRQYIALLPLDEIGEEEGDVFSNRYIEIWTPSRRPSSFCPGAEAPPRTGKDPHPFRFLFSRK